VIRIAPLMPISTRVTPLYVPVNWLLELSGERRRIDLEQHGWPRPLADHWVNIRDYDPGYVRAFAERLENDTHFHGMWS